MSSAWAAVRFPDGTVRAASYSGTSDILRPRLVDTLRAASALRDAPGWELMSEGPIEPVDIYSDYGGGFWWQGQAARNLVVDGTAPFGIVDAYGMYLWPPCEVHDGRPAWVDEWLATQ